MKYILIDQRNGDWFTEEFNTAEEAIKAGDLEWGRLSERDRAQCEAFYVLKSVNPDSDGVEVEQVFC